MKKKKIMILCLIFKIIIVCLIFLCVLEKFNPFKNEMEVLDFSFNVCGQWT